MEELESWVRKYFHHYITRIDHISTSIDLPTDVRWSELAMLNEGGDIMVHALSHASLK